MKGETELLEDLLERWEDLAERGEEPSPAELCREHPHLLAELERRIEALRSLGWMRKFQAPSQKNGVLAVGAEPIPGYILIGPLGRGGMGDVWKARSPSGELVALKVVGLAGKAARAEWRGFEALKGTRHPNVLTTYDARVTDSGLVIAMELADGSLLERFCQARDGGMVGIPEKELFPYLEQAGAGIDALNEQGIQHRDIKPSNLLLVSGVVKVADFGLAKFLENTFTGHTGSFTLAYSAPEFLDGKTARQSDQYSLAVTYCHLRGGRLPFDGTPAQIVRGHSMREPDLSMLPEQERGVVARALAKAPEERWPSCRAFVEALSRAGRCERFTDPTAPLPGPHPKRRKSLLYALVALFLLAGLVLALWPSTAKDSPPPAKKLTPPAQGAPEAEKVFVFDGRSRIVTPVERFAPVTLEGWVFVEPPLPGMQERYLIGSDIPNVSGISVGVRYSVYSPKKQSWDWERSPLMMGQSLPTEASPYPFIWTAKPFSHGRWSHFAGVFGPERTVFFLDGDPVTEAGPSDNRGGTHFVVGNAGETNTECYFRGQMKRVRISRGARYGEKFLPPASFDADESSVLIYDARHIREGQALDLSGKGNHGKLEGVSVRELPRQ